ncbi:mitochondrial uncoupling protein 2 [Lingula anatina]|uniref:Mitochondrial uncoupling protein 2 n=1 Tax=Lingula anatina TaxID=7574 RepID=A0A1S3IZK3_LINAN|nr:mitochondrial uncoupling protein 2-like [Lingula anatina]XP_013403443.1 mitochondrial uncoupling protein 2-like [Lingula anatina]XP_013415451.1 mitochondrial uncoupling protein 2 [Lingula anatina]|eukprot:XP_013403442.1 mitochondrial uncoupling protein 2-like [Lingula anatina]
MTSAPKVPEFTLGTKILSAGLAACTADVITFPLDMAKVRLQIQGESALISACGAHLAGAPPKYHGVFGTIRTIVIHEGARGLYGGLVAGLQRQMCFASVRIGLYDHVKGYYHSFFNRPVSEPHIGIRILAGVTTGALAVQIAQPTDVVKVRMQAQGNGVLPKRYDSAFSAYKTIAKQEGIRGLWKGTIPNMTRNAVVNCCELVSYDIIKEKILDYDLMSDNMPCHFVSGFGAGFVTTVIASPVDVVKTRFMNSGKGTYRGAFHCATKMLMEEGPMAFYKGFTPSFLRLGSWNIAMFVCFEQYKRFMYRAKASSDSMAV